MTYGVTDKQRADLIFLIADTNNYLSLPMAARIAERIIAEGWQWHPPVIEEIDLDHNKVELKPHEEVDMLDRIVHNLPANITNVRVHPDHPGIADIIFPSGRKLYDVASLHPQEVTELWKRIPEFENYEMNLINKDIRNRFTKRILETTNESGYIYTEVHDKEGFPHYISVEHVFEQMSE